MDCTHDPTGAPVLKTPSVAESRQPAIYYRDSGASVTDTWLVVEGRRYAVAELVNPRTVSGSRNSVVRGAAVVSGAVALIILLIGRYLSTAGWIGAAIVLAVPLVVLAGELLRTQRRYELWAEYRGLTVRLLCEDDAERYGKILRALVLVCREPALGPDQQGGVYREPALGPDQQGGACREPALGPDQQGGACQ